MNVFIDTSAFYAALSKTDINHARAVSDWNRLMDDEAIRLCTSNYVVVETCALVRNRLGDDAMRSFLGNILPLAMVIWIDQKAHASATAAMLAYGKNGPSMVDCSSFAIMRDTATEKALAYDGHFTDEGFLL